MKTIKILFLLLTVSPAARTQIVLVGAIQSTTRLDTINFTSTPLLLVGVSWEVGLLSVTPLLHTTANSFAFNTSLPIDDELTIYNLTTVTLRDRKGFSGFGITKKVTDGLKVYFEIGSTWHKWKPGVSLGVSKAFILKKNKGP